MHWNLIIGQREVAEKSPACTSTFSTYKKLHVLLLILKSFELPLLLSLFCGLHFGIFYHSLPHFLLGKFCCSLIFIVLTLFDFSLMISRNEKVLCLEYYFEGVFSRVSFCI